MSNLTSLVINDSGFAFNPTTGESYTINATGRMVIDRLRTGSPAADIARSLADHFRIPFEEAFTDVLEFRTQLRIYGMGEER